MTDLEIRYFLEIVEQGVSFNRAWPLFLKTCVVNQPEAISPVPL
jgi:hypothetical protein